MTGSPTHSEGPHIERRILGERPEQLGSEHPHPGRLTEERCGVERHVQSFPALSWLGHLTSLPQRYELIAPSIDKMAPEA